MNVAIESLTKKLGLKWVTFFLNVHMAKSIIAIAKGIVKQAKTCIKGMKFPVSNLVVMTMKNSRTNGY